MILCKPAANMRLGELLRVLSWASEQTTWFLRLKKMFESSLFVPRPPEGLNFI